MTDRTKPYLDRALEEAQKIYPDIQEVYLPEDIEIGVTHESGKPIYIFYSIFYERGQRFGGPLGIPDSDEFVKRLVESTIKHYQEQHAHIECEL